MLTPKRKATQKSSQYDFSYKLYLEKCHRFTMPSDSLYIVEQKLKNPSLLKPKDSNDKHSQLPFRTLMLLVYFCQNLLVMMWLL